MKRVLPLLLSAAALAAAAIPALAAAPPERLRRFERVLAEIPVGGAKLRLVATGLRGRIGDPCYETIESLRVDGGHGRSYADTMPSPWKAADGSLRTGVSVSAARIAWGKVNGLVMHRTYVRYALAEDSIADWRYLAVRGDRLVAISPWCDAHGQAFPGFRLTSVKAFGWFDALIPVRLHVGRHHADLAWVPRKDHASGLATLPIFVSETAERDSTTPETRILLYRGPVGSEGDSLGVPGGTPIEFGSAYADIARIDGTRSWDDCPPWHVTETRVALRRLEVVVGGRRGFVEPRDFPALGLESEE